MGNTALDLEAIEARCEAARCEMNRLCRGDTTWTKTTVSVREDDTDIILTNSFRDIPALVAEVKRLREELELHKELYVFSENDMGMMRAQRDGARDVCAFYRKQLRTFADHCKAAPSIRCWSTRYWLKLRALTKGKKNG